MLKHTVNKVSSLRALRDFWHRIYGKSCYTLLISHIFKCFRSLDARQKYYCKCFVHCDASRYDYHGMTVAMTQRSSASVVMQTVILLTK
jgi:hypothetical protein